MLIGWEPSLRRPELSATDRAPFSVAIREGEFRTYFYLTKRGTDFHLADLTW